MARSSQATRESALCIGLLCLALTALPSLVDGFALQQPQLRVPRIAGPVQGPLHSQSTISRNILSTSSNILHAQGQDCSEHGSQILLAERSVNRVTLMGRVGLEPEVRLLPSGDRMASFSLATSEQWRDKANGEVRSRTEWHRVVIFDQGLVELVENFVHKGRRLYVEGALQTRRWMTTDGQERYTTEVMLAKYRGELVLLENPEDKVVSSSSGASTRGISDGFQASGRPAGTTAPASRNGAAVFGTQRISGHGDGNSAGRAERHWE